MTILPNNKKSVGSGKVSAGAGSSNNCNNAEVENSHHSGQHSHPISLPSLQPDNLALGVDRVFASNLASGPSLWSHNPNHSLSLNLAHGNSRDDSRPSKPTMYDLEPGCSHSHGKRRHRLSPLRSTRNKRRADRDRSNTASPNTSTAPVPVSVPAEVVGASAPGTSAPDANGCNSEDEYESRPQNQMTEAEMDEREIRFEKKLRKKDLIIKSMGEDGACLFRAVADQVYGDQDMHSVVRRHCMDYIAKNRDYFSQYVTEDFNHYVSRKRMEHVHGNHIEIQALSEMYNRTIEVFCYSTEPINTFHGTPQTDNAPIRLSYHKGIHYNSLVDPYKPTVGVGLGLPGHIPGSADQNLLNEAAIQSEQVHLEQAMLEDKLRATDWEATSEAMEEQIARESYLQWLKDNERRNRVARSPNASSSSGTAGAVTSSPSEMRSPRPRSHAGSLSPLGSPFRGDVSFRKSPSRLSPPPSVPGSSRSAANLNKPIQSPPLVGATSLAVSPPGSPEHVFQPLETPSFINQLPPEMFGMTAWEDAGIIAQVLAASQQEYLDKLKKVHEHSPPAPPPAPAETMEEPKSGDGLSPSLPESKKPDTNV